MTSASALPRTALRDRRALGQLVDGGDEQLAGGHRMALEGDQPPARTPSARRGPRAVAHRRWWRRAPVRPSGRHRSAGEPAPGGRSLAPDDLSGDVARLRLQRPQVGGGRPSTEHEQRHCQVASGAAGLGGGDARRDFECVAPASRLHGGVGEQGVQERTLGVGGPLGTTAQLGDRCAIAVEPPDGGAAGDVGRRVVVASLGQQAAHGHGVADGRPAGEGPGDGGRPRGATLGEVGGALVGDRRAAQVAVAGGGRSHRCHRRGHLVVRAVAPAGQLPCPGQRMFRRGHVGGEGVVDGPPLAGAEAVVGDDAEHRCPRPDGGAGDGDCTDALQFGHGLVAEAEHPHRRPHDAGVGGRVGGEHGDRRAPGGGHAVELRGQGDRQLGRRGRHGGAGHPSGSLVGAERADELDRHGRVAPGERRHAPRHPVRHRHGVAHGGHDCLEIQSVEDHELVADGLQRVAGVPAVDGHQHGDRLAVHPPQGEGHDVERGGIDLVAVVDGDQQRPLFAEAGQQAPEPRTSGANGHVGVAQVDGRQQAVPLGGRQLAESVDDGVEQREQRGVRHVGVDGPAVRGQHADRPLGRRVARPLDQPGATGPRGAADGHSGRAAGDGPAEGIEQWTAAVVAVGVGRRWGVAAVAVERGQLGRRSGAGRLGHRGGCGGGHRRLQSLRSAGRRSCRCGRRLRGLRGPTWRRPRRAARRRRRPRR